MPGPVQHNAARHRSRLQSVRGYAPGNYTLGPERENIAQVVTVGNTIEYFLQKSDTTTEERCLSPIHDMMSLEVFIAQSVPALAPRRRIASVVHSMPPRSFGSFP
jgi:hypothetical protein